MAYYRVTDHALDTLAPLFYNGLVK